MQRVMIIGQPGSGKTNFARRLGAETGLPVHHIDRILWQSGWVERSRDEKTRMCRQIHAGERWILEGGHSATWPERLARADTVIWLDVGLARRLLRIVRRTLLGYGRTRPGLPEGCPERFDPDFFRFIWRTRASARAEMARLAASAPPEKSVVRLRAPRDVETYLANVARAMRAGALGCRTGDLRLPPLRRYGRCGRRGRCGARA